METPLSPLEFMRRARKLHAMREAVVDRGRRWTYSEFGARCDRWSSALARLGVRQGDRVGTIAPNTHQHLEQYYAVPQLGAVLVPMNYRLSADEAAYVTDNSDALLIWTDAEYAELFLSIRKQTPKVREIVVFGGEAPKGTVAADDWLKGVSENEPMPPPFE